jgi:hypothetical protein
VPIGEYARANVTAGSKSMLRSVGSPISIDILLLFRSG